MNKSEFFVVIIIALIIASISISIYVLAKKMEGFNNLIDESTYKYSTDFGNMLNISKTGPDGKPVNIGTKKDNPEKKWYYSVNTDPTHGQVLYGAYPELMSIKKDSEGKSALRINIQQDNNLGSCPSNTLCDLSREGKSCMCRKAIRMYTNPDNSFDEGLWVFDISHIPEGAGVWPAIWLLGADNWGCGGEIDIIESANSLPGEGPPCTAEDIPKGCGGRWQILNQAKPDEPTFDSWQNKSTLHISPPTDDLTNVCCQKSAATKGIEGDCGTVNEGAKECIGCGEGGQCPFIGCGKKYIKDNNQINNGLGISFGVGFNNVKGGYYVCRVKNDQVTIWFYSRNTPENIPDDLKSTSTSTSNLNPDNWTNADQKIEFAPCGKNQFKKLQVVINTTLCGDWAGNTFPWAATPSINTPWYKNRKVLGVCNQTINKPVTNQLSKAYWDIRSIKYFIDSSSPSPIR